MKTDPQHMLPAHLPFYRRRWFWAVVFFIFFVISTTLFMLSIIADIQSNYTSTFIQKIDDALLSFGSSLFMLYGFKIGIIYGYFGTITYFILMTFLGYKTFQRNQVSMKYPIIFSVLYLTGLIPIFMFNGF
jgi:hypothetical protein